MIQQKIAKNMKIKVLKNLKFLFKIKAITAVEVYLLKNLKMQIFKTKCKFRETNMFYQNDLKKYYKIFKKNYNIKIILYNHFENK